ncbi:MAG: serine/threonine-protein kinase [Methylococcales bacterium]
MSSTDVGFSVNPEKNSSFESTLIPGSAPIFAKNNSRIGNSNSPTKPIRNHFTVFAEPLELGDILKDRFVLVDSLGEGGMGMVFKALDKRKVEAEDRDPYVAIKVLRPEMSTDQKLFMGLQRETKRAHQLSHPNIIQVYDFDRDGKHVFMSMEYLTGQTLSTLIKTASPITLIEAWPIIEGMGLALACAHDNNIVHSDFKPSNVYIKYNGVVKVLDFGIASKFNSKDNDDEDKTRYNPRGLGALTEAYASLEMLEGIEPPDPRDDVYAFGCVIYQLLTGNHPFSMLSAKQVYEFNKDPQNRNRKLTPSPIIGLSHKQMEALHKALSLERKQRTKTISELLDNLRNQHHSWKSHSVFGLALAAAFATGLWFNRHTILPTPVTSGKEQVVAKNLANIQIQPGINPSVQSKPIADADVSASTRKNHFSTSPNGLARLSASKSKYKIGEQLQLRFSVTKPLYARMIHRGAKGEISALLPNPFQPSQLLKPNQEYSLPPKGAKFSIDVEGPVGDDTVTLLLSEQPIPAKLKLLAPDGALLKQVQETSASWVQISYSVYR